MVPKPWNRRLFLKKSALALAVSSTGQMNAGANPPRETRDENRSKREHSPIKLFCCDLNFSMIDGNPYPSAPQDWAFLDPKEYFEWHREFGNSACFMQAYTFGGYAFYPSNLGPLAPGPGKDLLPRLYQLARDAGMPFWSYMCIGMDNIMSRLRPTWNVPGTQFFAPEGPWTDLLCKRIREFLGMYPVDWMLFDWFVYGSHKPEGHPVQPAPFVERPFQEIIGRPMPDKAEEVTPEENITYKREILARQFRRIQEAVKQTSPKTKIIFNVPYLEPRPRLWVDHPMIRESEGIFSEYTNPDIMEWVLSAIRPEQRLVTNLRGHGGEGFEADPTSWRHWLEEGCDFFGYAWGTPPDFRPHRKFQEEVAVVRDAFREMG